VRQRRPTGNEDRDQWADAWTAIRRRWTEGGYPTNLGFPWWGLYHHAGWAWRALWTPDPWEALHTVLELRAEGIPPRIPWIARWGGNPSRLADAWHDAWQRRDRRWRPLADLALAESILELGNYLKDGELDLRDRR